MGTGGVKLLLDENLSHRLVPILQVAFPGTAHAVAEGLSGADDLRVWRHARDNGFVLVSKDDDFIGLAARHGPPLSVIRLSIGNSSNAAVHGLLVEQRAALEATLEDRNVALIELRSSNWTPSSRR